MPRRVTLTDRQKDALLRLPTSQTDLLKHYTLSDEDLGHIRLRRRAHNRFGFALQLCVLRYPGRVLAPGELIPAEVIEFIGAQLGLGADDLVDYAAREETRHEHLAELRGLYGFRTFSGRGASELKEWLFREAEMAVSNEDIARRFARKPAVSVQFSPLMSWTMQLPGHVSSVGTTSPTPLPLRVGAKHKTCSGPSWRR